MTGGSYNAAWIGERHVRVYRFIGEFVEDVAMQYEEHLVKSPEPQPEAGVAPFWRVLAILGIIGVIGLAIVALTMGLALVQVNVNRGASAKSMSTPVPSRP